MAHGTLEGLPLRWSADSRWLTLGAARRRRPTRHLPLRHEAAKTHQVTSGYFNDAQPVFDPDGKYLYFFSNRAFEPVYSDFDNSWSYPNATPHRRGAAAPRRRLAARRRATTSRGDEKDEDEGRRTRDEGQGDKDEGRGQEGRTPRTTTRRRRTPRRTARRTTKRRRTSRKPVAIDIEGSRRASVRAAAQGRQLRQPGRSRARSSIAARRGPDRARRRRRSSTSTSRSAKRRPCSRASTRSR